jgi:phage terminase small subunit
MPMKKLTLKQERFIQEYLWDENAQRSAIAAGYSQRTAAQIGYQLLQLTSVQRAIAKGQAERAQRCQITRDRTLKELARIAFSDLGEAFGDEGQLLSVKEMPEAVRRVISSVKVRRVKTGDDTEDEIIEVKTWSKDAALDKLCKHLGIYAEEGSPPPTVNVNLFGQDLSKLSPDELIKLHRQTLAIPSEGHIQPGGDGPGTGTVPA